MVNCLIASTGADSIGSVEGIGDPSTLYLINNGFIGPIGGYSFYTAYFIINGFTAVRSSARPDVGCER